jgi:hypothetical protein
MALHKPFSPTIFETRLALKITGQAFPPGLPMERTVRLFFFSLFFFSGMCLVHEGFSSTIGLDL